MCFRTGTVWGTPILNKGNPENVTVQGIDEMQKGLSIPYFFLYFMSFILDDHKYIGLSSFYSGGNSSFNDMHGFRIKLFLFPCG